MDDALRALERRWTETGAEPDQHRWLCARLRQGWSEALRPDMQALEQAFRAAFFPEDSEDPDVEAECVLGFETEGGPRERLAALSKHLAWYPVTDPARELAKVLDPGGMVGLYPHASYDVSDVDWRFLALFEGGTFFANFQDSGRDGNVVWSRSSSRLRGPRPDWEFSANLAIGAVLGPLVGFLSVNARESL